MINTLTMVRQLKKKFPHNEITIKSEHHTTYHGDIFTAYEICITREVNILVYSYAELVEKVKSIISDPDNKILKEA